MVGRHDDERVVVGVDALQLRDDATDQPVGGLDLEQVALAGRERATFVEPLVVEAQTRDTRRAVVGSVGRVVPR